MILRLAPYVLTFGLFGSTLAWQDVAARRVADDLGTTPRVLVDEYSIPTVKTDVPVLPAPRRSDGVRSAQAEGGAEAESDGSEPQPSAEAPVVIAELTPRKVDPFSLIGVTWASGVPASATVTVRWHSDDGWSNWTHLDQDLVPGEEGRAGTEPYWVGRADAVAVRVTSPVRAVPQDLQIAAIDPGEARGIAPVAASQPGIIMRSQWHARAQGNCSEPRYNSTLGAVLHHTAGSNSYSKAESAGIVRSIQAFHMQSRHWCDIGYNFLVDRYGQIFEGRGGGINLGVRGAHSGNLAVNEHTIGVSMMGTFDNVAPTSATKTAVARLIAWRFSIGHIPPKGMVTIGGKNLNRISGHRDVISDDCPGAYAYAWLNAKGGLRDMVAQMVGASTPPLTGFRSAVRSSSVIDYAWNPVKNAPRYQLVISRSSTFSGVSSRVVGPDHVRVSGLAAGAVYYAKVRALNAGGGPRTDWSPVIARRTWPPPGRAGIPTGLHLSDRSATALKFVWNPVPGAARYQIRLSRTSSMAGYGAIHTTTRTATFTRLSPHTTYYAKVIAYSGQNTLLGGWSKTIAVTTSAAAATKPVAYTPTREVAVPSSGSYTFRGHGYGHGIGMGQYGAAGAARSGKTYWSILAFYYPGTTSATRTGNIRVLISGDTTRNVKVKAKAGLAFRIGSGSPITLPTTMNGATISRWSIEPEGGAQSSLQYKTDAYHSYRTWSGPARFEAPTIDLIFPDESVRTYRTSLVSALPTPTSSGRDTVNELSLEDYTRGVVAREMPSTFAAEALKAQSVAARTYGARSIRTDSYYDICDTTSCQVYGGARAETPETNSAVAATAGRILTYQGLPALTQFSSSSGGYTDVGSQPYLRPATDAWDDWSGNPRHSWSVAVTASKISAKYPEIGTLKALQVTDRNGYGEWGGRVRALKLIGSQGTKTISGNTARSDLGLRSNWFTF